MFLGDCFPSSFRPLIIVVFSKGRELECMFHRIICVVYRRSLCQLNGVDIVEVGPKEIHRFHLCFSVEQALLVQFVGQLGFNDGFADSFRSRLLLVSLDKSIHIGPQSNELLDSSGYRFVLHFTNVYFVGDIVKHVSFGVSTTVKQVSIFGHVSIYVMDFDLVAKKIRVGEQQLCIESMFLLQVVVVKFVHQDLGQV